MTPVVELAIPPRSAYVGVVRLAVASLARAAGLDEVALDDLKIAVSEACANAVLSNSEAGSDEAVTVTWSASDDRLTVEVGDRGELYESAEADYPTSSHQFDNRMVLSVALLQSLVDECEFVPREDGGTFTKLVVNL